MHGPIKVKNCHTEEKPNFDSTEADSNYPGNFFLMNNLFTTKALNYYNKVSKKKKSINNK